MLQIAFDQVVEILADLGFEQSREKGHVHFRHSSSGTVILLPLSCLDGWVNEPDIASIRRHLDETGLLTIEQFNERTGETRSPLPPWPAAGESQ